MICRSDNTRYAGIYTLNLLLVDFIMESDPQLEVLLFCSLIYRSIVTFMIFVSFALVNHDIIKFFFQLIH